MFRHVLMDQATDGDAGTSAGVSTTVTAGGAWAETLGDDLKPWVSGMGLDKLPADQALAKVLPMYRGAEQKLGIPADQILKLPGKDAKPEDWRSVYQKLGAPESPDGYELTAPEGDSGEFLKTASGWFHELGVPKALASGLAEKWNGYVQAAQVAEEGRWNQQFDTEIAALRKEWGDSYDKNVDLSKRVERSLGLNVEQLQGIEKTLGPGVYQKFLHKFGSQLGEHKFTGGGEGGSFGMTPEAARSRIADLKKDAGWTTKYTNGDADAKAEWTRLHQIAFPDQQAA
jgi:hypothetical protein